jgi:hypothetical protein
MSPNAGGGGAVAGSRPMSTAVHRSPNKLWRSNFIFNLWFLPTGHPRLRVRGWGGSQFGRLEKKPRTLSTLVYNKVQYCPSLELACHLELLELSISLRISFQNITFFTVIIFKTTFSPEKLFKISSQVYFTVFTLYCSDIQ